MNDCVVFERRGGGSGSSAGGFGEEEAPLGVQALALCAESRRLAVALPHGHVLLFKFRKTEAVSETHVSGRTGDAGETRHTLAAQR